MTPRRNNFRNPTNGAVIAFAAAAVLALSAPVALASPSTVKGKSVRVAYVTSELANQESAQQLYARIHAAAHMVCGEADIRFNRRQRDVDACLAKSVARAVEDIASPVLLAVHQEATGDAAIRLAGSQSSNAR